MSNDTVIRGRITATRRLPASANGNPRYTVALATPDGETLILDTAPNAAINYAITNETFRAQDHAFTLNSRGKIAQAAQAD